MYIVLILLTDITDITEDLQVDDTEGDFTPKIEVSPKSTELNLLADNALGDIYIELKVTHLTALFLDYNYIILVIHVVMSLEFKYS